MAVLEGVMVLDRHTQAPPQSEWVDLTGKDWRSALKEAETIVQKSDPLEALLQVFGERLLAKFKEKNTPVQREQQEPVACMVKGRLLSYKDNTIPNDCLLYLAPPSVEAMRLETLEKAAKACDDLGKTPFIPNHDVHVLPPTPQQCAAAIRGMK